MSATAERQKVTQREIIERLWAALDEVNHQGKWPSHCSYNREGPRMVVVRTDVRECRSCRQSIRAARVALKGLSFTEARAWVEAIHEAAAS